MARYLATNDPQQIRVTLAVDGMRHRMIDNEFIRHLEAAGPIGRLWIALRSARKWKAQTGMSTTHMIKTFFTAIKDDPSAMSQVVMAANQPVLLQRSMVEGFPAEGILPSGQVAAAIDNLPSCAELIESIVHEAEQCLERLQIRCVSPTDIESK